ncbi:predicted protein [Nematostella vectensis]|uniref:Uracil-DNA glycosylase-like domain-containing protein n=1 Tax=Nematostella vectensis TaxID=45351 RepID=A7RG31_NEMVE|nr:single-strand selective monofunctional uracil DNA glycosylase [Nematostella vectensis]EDO49461.1 predicted protein [Nematostella vectensis]|eukprot:XP_001641524.1 predicted protein [Nematostella vectensis]
MADSGCLVSESSEKLSNSPSLKRSKQLKAHKSQRIAKDVFDIETTVCRAMCMIDFGFPVCYIYNPIEYASETHINFLDKYCTSTKKVLFLGMNPGPFGMAQNGVPFGDTSFVKDWLEIDGEVRKPLKEHPKRPILGLDCKRSEVSGSRLWGLIKQLCKTPEVFFSSCFIHNYCPLVFMNESGKNITPPNLPVEQRKQLYNICDQALIEMVELLGTDTVVGIGKFAEGRCRSVLKDSSIRVYPLMHPSPASPIANAGWSEIAMRQLQEAGLMQVLIVD